MLIWAKTRKVRPSENRAAFGQILFFFKKLFATVQHIGRRSRKVTNKLTFSQNWKKWLLCTPLIMHCTGKPTSNEVWGLGEVKVLGYTHFLFISTMVLIERL